MYKQINKTPLVRFPEFKDDWVHKQLNKLLSVSKTTNKDLKYGKEEVLSVSGESGIVNQIKHLGRSYAGVSVHNYGVVELNQIVYTKSPLKANPYGIIKLNKHKAGIASTLYAVYNVNQETDGQFIEYYFSLDANLNRYLRPLVRKGAKNTLQVTDDEAIKGKLFYPHLKEQEKIAHFFSIVDQKLNQLQEKLNGLEQYKKGMMQQIFSQKLRFKDENGNTFPDWEKKKLGEIAIFLKGKGISKSDIAKNGKNQCIRYGELYTHYKEVITKIKSATNIDITKLVLSEENDIIIPASGEDAMDIATASCVLKKGIVLGGDLNIIRTKNNGVFLSFYLNNKLKIKIARLAQGVSVVHLYSRQLSSLKLDLPPIPEQTKIANFLSKIDEKINVVNTQIEATKTYKKGLLQKMFV